MTRFPDCIRHHLFSPSAICRTLRFRFALWLSLLLLVILIVFSAFVYVSLEDRLNAMVDESLRLNAAQISAILEVNGSALQLPDNTAADNLGEISEEDISVRILTREGNVLYASGAYRNIRTPVQDLNSALDNRPQFSTIADPYDDEDQVRLYTAPITRDGEVIGVIQTAQSLETTEDTLENLLTLLQVSIPALVLMAAFSGYWLAASTLRPIDQMTKTARQISAEDLSTRLNFPPTNDEVGRLAATFDMMLARLEDAFRREQQFVSDASHELRTPLAAIRTITELTLNRERSTDAYQQALNDIDEETLRLQNLAQDLLRLARKDSYHLSASELERIDLAALVGDVVETMQPLAKAKELLLTYQPDDNCYIVGESSSLIRLFINLIDNAIKYTEHGSITVKLRRQGDKFIKASITDSGRGIPTEHITHVFDRFYRIDASRSTPGSGLGLTIAHAIIDAHNGTIEIKSDTQHGTTVLVVLPAEHFSS